MTPPFPNKPAELMPLSSMPLIKWRVWILSAWILVTICLLPGFKHLSLSGDYRAHFADDDPYWLTLQSIQQDFEPVDSIVIAIGAQNANNGQDTGKIFTKPYLNLIGSINQQLSELPYAGRINSLLTTPHIYQDRRQKDDTIIIEPPFNNFQITSEETLHHTGASLSAHPHWVGNLISKDGNHTLIHLVIHLPETEASAEPAEVIMADLTTAARQIIEQAKPLAPPNTEFHLTGTVVANQAYIEAIKQDFLTLLPISYLIILCLSRLFIGRIPHLIVTFSTLTLTNILTFAIKGWIEPNVSSNDAFAPTTIMLIAMADCVHLYHTYTRLGHLDRISAMQASLRLNVKPILITSLTTSLAMLCLNIHDSPTVASFGNTVAIGVMIAMLLSLSVTPLLMIFTSNQRVSGQDVLHTCVKSLSRIITAKKSRLFNLTSLMVGSLLLIFAIAGVGKLSSEESITQTFDQAFEFRKANDYLNQHLTGLHQLSIRIQNDKGSIINPTDLHKVDQLTRWLTSQSEVAYVDSITNELHQVKHIISGEPISEPLPTEPAILSQYWLLYQLGSPSITHRLTKVSLDEKTLLVSFRLWETDTNTMIDLESRLRAQIEATFSDHSSIRLDISGIDLAFAHLVTHNIDTLVKGTLAALFLVACLIMISLKSFRLGLVAVLTNLVPIIIVFGSWGHMVGNLGLSAASVGAITLGLVVDDTVHLIYRYFSLRSTAVKSSHQPMKKLTSAQCLAHTIEQVGPALVITTLIFSLGFSCLIFSHYVPTQIFGGLSAAILLTALAVDLIFLPSFFMFCIRNTFTKNKKQTNVNNLRIECQKEKSTNHPRGKVETTSSPEKSLS